VSGVARALTNSMRINVKSYGFELTARERGHVVSRLLSALGRFRVRIESAKVHLAASTRNAQPDTVVCGIVVNLHPSGEVHSRAEDPRMHVAIDRATAEIEAQIEREVSRSRPAVASIPVVVDGLDDRALETVLDENGISDHHSEILEKPDNSLPRVPIGENWRPPGAEDGELPDVRRSVERGRLRRGGIEKSSLISRVS
jgi:ribosomal subunit interface protein